MSLEKLPSSSFQSLCAEVMANLELGPPSFAASSSFLQGAGQSQIISQCEQLETDVCSLLEQRRVMLHTAVNVLHTYSTIVSQFGVVFAEDNRTFRFHGWLQELLNDFSSQKSEEVIFRYHDLYSLTQSSQLTKAQFVFGVEAKLLNLLNDSNSKLLKLMDRRAQETNETVMLELQVQEADEVIKHFVYENGIEGEKSLMSVIVSALYTLNKRYLLMEGAAAGAGDRLMDLTSRDGYWFLDELCSMSGNVNQFLETLNRYTQEVDMLTDKQTKAADTMDGLRKCLARTRQEWQQLSDELATFKEHEHKHRVREIIKNYQEKGAKDEWEKEQSRAGDTRRLAVSQTDAGPAVTRDYMAQERERRP